MTPRLAQQGLVQCYSTAASLLALGILQDSQVPSPNSLCLAAGKTLLSKIFLGEKKRKKKKKKSKKEKGKLRTFSGSGQRSAISDKSPLTHTVRHACS